MFFTGMIFQYDTNSKSGLLMLSNGEKKEFNATHWVDKQNQAAVGLKISYEQNAETLKVKVATQEDEQRALQEKEQGLEPQNEQDSSGDEFKNMEEYIAYFKDLGYRLVKDIQGDDSRDVELRIYTAEEYGDATIKQKGSKISVTQTLNGKTVYSD